MITIAIDGPTGAGKSTVAKTVADRLGYIYLDTGALYRSIAYWAIKQSVDIYDEDAVAQLLENMDIQIKYIDKIQHIFINDQDVSGFIRTPEVAEGSSVVSAHPVVRAWLVNLQRKTAKQNNVVMDGRDIGTVIMPGAQVKIYLTASCEQRAKRRYEEYLAKGENISYNNVLQDLVKRDERDFKREIAPLKKADDAVEVDSSNLTFEGTLEAILKIINDRI